MNWGNSSMSQFGIIVDGQNYLCDNSNGSLSCVAAQQIPNGVPTITCNNGANGYTCLSNAMNYQGTTPTPTPTPSPTPQPLTPVNGNGAGWVWFLIIIIFIIIIIAIFVHQSKSKRAVLYE